MGVVCLVSELLSDGSGLPGIRTTQCWEWFAWYQNYSVMGVVCLVSELLSEGCGLCGVRTTQ